MIVHFTYHSECTLNLFCDIHDCRERGIMFNEGLNDFSSVVFF